MSIINNQQSYANTIKYCEDNPEATLGDVVQNCVKPAMEKVFGSVAYAINSVEYPCVLLPSSDGVMSASYSPCIVFEANSTLIMANGSDCRVRFGLMDIGTRNTKQMNQAWEHQTPTSDSANGYVSVRLKNTNLVFNARDIDRGYQFGYYPINTTAIVLGSMVCKVLSGKDVITGDKTDVLIAEMHANESSMLLTYYKPSSDSIFSSYLERWKLPTQNVCANMYEFNDGNITVDNYYICFPGSQHILKPLCIWDSNVTSPDMWSSPVTINGSKFKLSIQPGAGSGGNNNITLAVKVQ